MSLFRSNPVHPGWPTVVGPIRVPGGLVRLRPIRLRDGVAWSRTRLADRAHLEPWEPVSELNWEARHAVSSWPSLCSGLRAEARRGRMLPYAIEVDGHFCGQLTIGNVTHGALRSAWIGYWVAKEVNGRGVATAALALGVDHGFTAVTLHRIEATVRPENGASRAVLARVGFREEGLLQRYLEVDGAWRDHLLVAMTVDELSRSATSALVHSGRASWA